MTPADPRRAAAPRLKWQGGQAEQGLRDIPEEAPIAIVHDGSTTAVMMATPADLEDFALGFSLTEGLIETPADIVSTEIAETDLGIEARLWLARPKAAALAARRRHLAGPAGCGLCGVDSLAEAIRPPRRVPDGGSISPSEVRQVLAALSGAQALGEATRAVHAAGFWTREAGLLAAREDVGRHNALDKLAGALARAGQDASNGVVALTSRVSVEMVQKTAALGAPILVAVSAPTALAVRTAEAAGMTLIAVARSDGFEVFAGEHRLG